VHPPRGLATPGPTDLAEKAPLGRRDQQPVYAELEASDAQGLRYATFQLDDAGRVVEVVMGEDLPQPLPQLEAFRRYRADLEERCENASSPSSPKWARSACERSAVGLSRGSQGDRNGAVTAARPWGRSPSGRRRGAGGRARLRAGIRRGLDGLAAGDEVLVLTWLDRASRDVLRVHPRDDAARAEAGVFSTRSPDRPNPIGLHRVTVLAVDGLRLRVRPLEALDGTPVLDVKPVLGPVDER
jgi:tRNA-Thr(GGU) m(6)t(6)A37 methyltransferase TsaA